MGSWVALSSPGPADRTFPRRSSILVMPGPPTTASAGRRTLTSTIFIGKPRSMARPAEPMVATNCRSPFCMAGMACGVGMVIRFRCRPCFSKMLKSLAMHRVKNPMPHEVEPWTVTVGMFAEAAAEGLAATDPPAAALGPAEAPVEAAAPDTAGAAPPQAARASAAASIAGKAAAHGPRERQLYERARAEAAGGRDPHAPASASCHPGDADAAGCCRRQADASAGCAARLRLNGWIPAGPESCGRPGPLDAAARSLGTTLRASIARPW